MGENRISMNEPEFFRDLEQGSPEWFEIRRGIPTASEFQTILVDGKGAETLMRKLAGEIISGEAGEGYKNSAMARGQEMEAEARQHFASSRLLEVERCGFVRRKLPSGRYVGCSPDSFFESPHGRAVLEIKTMRPDLMIEKCEMGNASHKVVLPALPTEHKAQCMGALWVTGFAWVHLMTWYRGMPWAIEYACGRDKAYIATLTQAVIDFDLKLDAMVEKYRGRAYAHDSEHTEGN